MASVTPSAHSRPMKSVHRIDIDHRPTQKVGVNLKTQIETVMQETARGAPALTIAAKRGWDRELVEQIARLYVTHPGVTADGIMSKMGV